ncbi:MAG TPA: hypothetical protein VI462_15935 [Acidimicrobiia bacterium]
MNLATSLARIRRRPDRRLGTTDSGTVDDGSRPSLSSFAGRLYLASIGFALLPVVVAVGRAVVNGWTPLSDDALFAVRARDVFSYHNFPLVGLDSSTSLVAGTELHHPGPLQLDLLALPVRIFGGSAGLAVGVAIINVAAIVGIAVFAYRRGGALTGTLAMLLTAGLCWTMGSEALFEPWQPVAVLLPFLCFVVLAWSVSCGDLVALPVAALAGSFVLETHVSYVLLVPILAIWALAGVGLVLRARQREDPAGWPRLRRQMVRSVTIAALVFVVCWLQPLIDEVVGQGNLGRLLTNSSGGSRAFGYRYGVQLVASVVAVPPWWFRPSMNQTLLPSSGWTAPSLFTAASTLVALAVVLGLCWWSARRATDLETGRAAITAGLAVLAGLATAGRVPITVFGLEAHVFWWLWPISVFSFFVVGLTLTRRAAGHVQRHILIPVGTLATAVLAILAVPTLAQGLTPNTREYAVPTVHAVNAQLGRLTDRGPILVDPLLKSRLGDPYGLAIIAELQRRGIPIVAQDPTLVGQLGSHRRYTGRNARSELYLRVGNDRLVLPAGATQVVDHQGIGPSERRELAGLEAKISTYIRQGRLRLSQAGQDARRRAPDLVPDVQHADPDTLIGSGELNVLFDAGYLQLDHAWAPTFERFASLHNLEDVDTVALFLAPLPR